MSLAKEVDLVAGRERHYEVAHGLARAGGRAVGAVPGQPCPVELGARADDGIAAGEGDGGQGPGLVVAGLGRGQILIDDVHVGLEVVQGVVVEDLPPLAAGDRVLRVARPPRRRRFPFDRRHCAGPFVGRSGGPARRDHGQAGEDRGGCQGLEAGRLGGSEAPGWEAGRLGSRGQAAARAQAPAHGREPPRPGAGCTRTSWLSSSESGGLIAIQSVTDRPCRNFKGRSKVAADRDAPQVHVVVLVHDDRTEAFGPEQQRVHGDLQPRGGAGGFQVDWAYPPGRRRPWWLGTSTSVWSVRVWGSIPAGRPDDLPREPLARKLGEIK